MNIVPVILSGGSGTRLWPLSRALFPKQLLPLVNTNSLLQETVGRSAEVSASAPIIVCNEEHRFQVAEQVREIGISDARIILEPVGRNTAPAIAISAFEALKDGDDPILLVLPSDHLIKDVKTFSEVIQQGLQCADDGLITFGVKPTSPATGYGYIKAQSQGVSKIAEFVEKPDEATACSYLESGDYYWNSGMFMFKASRYLAELAEHMPEMHNICKEAYESVERDLDFLRVAADIFERCPSDSIDYAVMEKTQNAMVVPYTADWSDLGSWQALWDVGQKDSDGNVLKGDVLLNDVAGSYIRAEGRIVAAVGVKDHVIVETADAVLVADKNKTEDIKAIVSQLNSQQREEANLHTKVFRPWGSYESIDESERFKVKRITVKPGASLSLQMHHHRAEHWIVVTGTAKVVCEDKEFLLSENESTYIPVGAKHRLENPGTIQVELIEVQSGSYLGEDDIVRFEDKYGR